MGFGICVMCPQSRRFPGAGQTSSGFYRCSGVFAQCSQESKCFDRCFKTTVSVPDGNKGEARRYQMAKKLWITAPFYRGGDSILFTLPRSPTMKR